MSKPTLAFSNFWQANYFVENGILQDVHAIYSIALKIPQERTILSINGIKCLEFFCPNWEILNKYHKDKDWEAYTESFIALMKTRNTEAKAWLDSLQKDVVYMLCCWENTSKGAHCHRQLIYDAFKKNKKYSNELNLIYPHGNEKTL